MRDEELFPIGYIGRLHGIGGEVEMVFTDDIFDRTDSDYVFLRIDGLPVPFYIEEYRFKNQHVAWMKFEHVDTAEQAQVLRGAEVLFPKEAVTAEATPPTTWAFLTGYTVYDEQTGLVGRIVAVDERSANVVARVERPDGSEVLLPCHPDLIRGYDEQARTLTFHLPEGILTLNA